MPATFNEADVPNKPGAKKTFLASWGSSFVKVGIEQVDESFFCEERAYEPDDIERISELEVGEVWTARHYRDHVVIRLADDVVVTVAHKGQPA